MKILKDTYKNSGNIHHAYAFSGQKDAILPSLLNFIKKDFGLQIKNNPDFFYQEFETFTIDDGRDLQGRHSHRAIDGRKIFIISTRFITSEAQNALLKIFEEPSLDTHFFLIMPNTEVLIPTLKSRLVIVRADDLKETESNNLEIQNLVKKFLAVNPAERINLVKPIVEDKDKGKAIDFVTALEKALVPGLKKADSTVAASLKEILMVKKYLHDRAPSVKLLLEHLCLSVTITKL
jgi:DNA polymerase-3 subunit delta'